MTRLRAWAGELTLTLTLPLPLPLPLPLTLTLTLPLPLPLTHQVDVGALLVGQLLSPACPDIGEI